MRYLESLGVKMSVRNKARNLAFSLYKDIKYGSVPYTDHLHDVASILLTFEFPSDSLGAAAWLHDSIEDRLLTFEQVHREFGPRVSALVWSVTDGRIGNRAFRKAASYAKMQKVPKAILLKIADRIANVRACVKTENEKLLAMYQKEQAEFQKQLQQVSEKAYPKCVPMWEHLQSVIQPDSAESTCIIPV
jgi:(p)ppGpp synthase/HD superfamily hydrolase